MWAVNGDGWDWVRQARERLAEVVGTRARRSYGAMRPAFAFVWLVENLLRSSAIGGE